MATVIVGLGLLGTTGLHTSFFPTIFLAYFAIGLGIGSVVHAAADDRDGRRPGRRRRPGLGDHQRLPAGRRRARPRRARHDRHQPHQGARGARATPLASSLVGGYHLAFAIGAASVVVGIVTALVVLRTRAVPEDATAEVVAYPEPTDHIARGVDPQVERQAA